MKSLAYLEEQLALLNKERSLVESQIISIKEKTLVQCTDSKFGIGCGMAMEIKNLDYIKVMYYVTPIGCTGGDYWDFREGNFICSHCGHTNRLYDRPDIDNLRDLFKSIVTETLR